jgi:hypothetical protein
MKKYKLLLVGCFPSWRENTSCSFFSEEFRDYFCALPHVELITHHFDDHNLPNADFALVHAYHEQAILMGKLLKSKVKKSSYFMENHFDYLGYDHYFFYDPEFIKPRSDQTFIKIPLVKKYYEVAPKRPKTLLLDHDANLFPFAGNPLKDWNKKIWNILSKDRCGYERIAQLGRHENNHPDFIEVIPKQSHQDYLNATKDFETYFITHLGSYNHTAVDMAVRGIRTIVPKGFVPVGLSQELGMIEVTTDEQIIAALKDHGAGKVQIDKATEFSDLANKIDEYFQSFC